MDKELMEQLQLIISLIGQNSVDIKSLRAEMQEEIQASETRLKVYMENAVAKRLDMLTEGYTQTYEEQFEARQKTARLERDVEDLRTRVEILEHRTAGN